MVKVLFLIHDLGQGGAEKVLINLVNHMDKSKYDITVISLFGGGVGEKLLCADVKYKTVFRRMIPGNSRWMKLWTPRQLHKMYVKGHYDIEISYLEGPSARVVSGCTDKNTKLVSWIHSIHGSKEMLSKPFRSLSEAIDSYSKFDTAVCVSSMVKDDFLKCSSYRKPSVVLYNTVDSEDILKKASESSEIGNAGQFNMIAVGTLKEVKGFDRLLKVICRLRNEKYPVHLFIAGQGPMHNQLKQFTDDNHISENVTFLGYQSNPYKYVSKCDLFVCSSYSEGFSTACTEALIVGTPVCTTDVSGMREMLGDSEYGLITENSEEGLYQGIKRLLDDRDLLSYYKIKAAERGLMFNTENTVRAVEEMLEKLYEETDKRICVSA